MIGYEIFVANVGGVGTSILFRKKPFVRCNIFARMFYFV